MTGTIDVRVVSTDETASLARLLLYSINSDDTSPSLYMSILRVMCMEKPEVLEKKYPKYEENESAFAVFGSSKKLRELIRQASQVASRGIDGVLGAKETLMESVLGKIEFPKEERRWIVARASDFGRTRVTYELDSLVKSSPKIAARLNQEDAEAFRGKPLKVIDLKKWILSKSCEEKVSGSLPFDISKHPSTKTHIAKDIIKRMVNDKKIYAEMMNKMKRVYVVFERSVRARSARITNTSLVHTTR